jgi:hypothetical protein
MPDLRLPLTDKNVLGLPLATAGQYRARDLDLGGFYLLVGKRTKSFVVAGDLRAGGLRQKTVRMTIGEAGEISCRDARARARAILGQLADGVDPRGRQEGAAKPSASVVSGPTLREAWERYRVSHLLRKKRSPATIAGYQDHVERLFGDWADKPLAQLGADPKAIADRHEAISAANGPTIANGAMRTFRAVYNHACKTAPDLPARNPVYAVDWNPEQRKDTALGAAELVVWFEQLVRLENPIRREFHLLTLLTGSRPEALKTAQPGHVDFARRIMHFPKPKGGERRAFDIPLSRQMIRSLVRLIRMGRLLYPEASEAWLFPSDAQCGHIAEQKENRETKLSHYGNDLRQTFRTLAKAAGVPDLDAKLLMNHALSGDVNAGYITRSKLMGDYLRTQQQTISDFAFAQLRQRRSALSPELLRWLEWSSRRQVVAMLEQDPDEVRARSANRSVVRKAHLQSDRCEAQNLPLRVLEPPSRRRRTGARALA